MVDNDKILANVPVSLFKIEAANDAGTFIRNTPRRLSATIFTFCNTGRTSLDSTAPETKRKTRKKSFGLRLKDC